jgi:hypothetical protein
LDLRIAGESEPFASLPLHPEGEACCAVERLRDLPARSIRLRTRALTTTMFARLFLGDLFIHGIGGAKYDELGDDIIRRFCGLEPPGFLTLSMTLRLGLPAQPFDPADLTAVNREIRDLTFNPERHLPEPFPEELRNIVEVKRATIAGPVTSRRERAGRARAIRRYNDAMQPWIQAVRGELIERRRAVREGLRAGRVARSREFASVLHSEGRLEAVMRGVAEKREPGPGI